MKVYEECNKFPCNKSITFAKRKLMTYIKIKITKNVYNALHLQIF